MKLLKYAIFLLVFGSAQAKEVIFDLWGSGNYVKANNNSMRELRVELKNGVISRVNSDWGSSVSKVDLGIVGTDDVDTYSRFGESNYKCKIAFDHGEWSNEQNNVIQCYINLRIGGFGSISAVKLLRIWSAQGRGFPPNDGMPSAEFEKLEKMPRWVNSLINEKIEPPVQFFILRDGDLAWILKGDDKKCDFYIGVDGQHFSSNAFEEMFEREFDGYYDKALDRNSASSLKASIERKWNVNWRSPFEISLPFIR